MWDTFKYRYSFTSYAPSSTSFLRRYRKGCRDRDRGGDRDKYM